MKLIKRKTYPLEKCYSVAPLKYNGREHIVVAAEKKNKCLLFDSDGNFEETIWNEPGGTMSIVQVPGSDGIFLASQKMYSPNDSKDAEIVIVMPEGKNDWQVKTLVKIPFVHRFDILVCEGKKYLIAATIKSGHEYKDDWSHPGRILVCALPDDLLSCGELHPACIKDGLLRNHGYIRMHNGAGDFSVVACDYGVFAVYPPCSASPSWRTECLTPDAASDIAFTDFDGDGCDEMVCISPFHGDTVSVYKKQNGAYRRVFTYDKKVEFAHAIWAGKLFGVPAAVIGHRKGESRDLFLLQYCDGTYTTEILDRDVGPANVYQYTREGREYLVSANREIDEIAFYEFRE